MHTQMIKWLEWLVITPESTLKLTAGNFAMPLSPQSTSWA